MGYRAPSIRQGYIGEDITREEHTTLINQRSIDTRSSERSIAV